MPKYGMALDNLRSVDLVTADGSVVRAAADENPDLFWGVRGGGGNFGVATSFEFQLHDVGPTVYGGLVLHPYAEARTLVRFFRDFSATVSDDVFLVGALLTGPEGDKLCAIAAAHCGALEDGEKALAPIKNFGTPVADMLGPIPYSQLNMMLDEGMQKGFRNYWKSHFLAGLDDAAIDAFVEAFASCPSPMSQALLEHFHGAATRVPRTETAFAMRSGGYNSLALSFWSDQADDEANIAWARDVYAALQPFQAPSRYANYMGEDDTGDETLAAVYGPNLPRLRDLKRKYDPDNVFHLNLNVPPA
jgi:FAD/FMN-containing dehydrogenase